MNHLNVVVAGRAGTGKSSMTLLFMHLLKANGIAFTWEGVDHESLDEFLEMEGRHLDKKLEALQNKNTVIHFREVNTYKSILDGADKIPLKVNQYDPEAMNVIHDALLEFDITVNEEQQKAFLHGLPDSIHYKALQWGYSDTVVRDDIATHLNKILTPEVLAKFDTNEN